MIRSWSEKKIIICCGTGGVGKTTTASALALHAALSGKRVALITVDPAKRLASSLGLKDLNYDAQCLDEWLERSLNLKLKGSFSALMLDSENTFYRFLRTIGGDEVENKFRASNLFEIIMGNFGGTHDYLAMEKLFELESSKKYDLIVLDTPPARHTLDFLDAPDLIAKFFDDRIFSWFLTDPRSTSLREKLRAQGTKAALRILELLTGESVIHDFIELAPHIYKVKNAFVERQSSIKKLLQSSHSGAIFITSPTDLSRGEALPFLQDAANKGIHILSFVVNRSLAHLATKDTLPTKLDPEIVRIYQNIRLLVKEEEKNLTLLKELAGNKTSVWIVPEMESDVHDLKALQKLSAYF